MAEEVKKLVTVDTRGLDQVTEIGKMDEEAMQQTLDLAKQYIVLDGFRRCTKASVHDA